MRSLTRLGVGLGVAGVLTLGLHLALQAGSAAERERSRDLEPSGGYLVILPDSLPRGTAGRLYLASKSRPLPAAVAPVVEILPGGQLRPRRPASVPAAPDDSGFWLAAGVILPVERLADLGPVERASLLEVWRAWSGGGGVRPERLAAWGVDASREELMAMARWTR